MPNIIDSSDLRAYELEWALKLTPDAKFAPYEDPLFGGATHRLDINNPTISFYIGTIADAVASTGSYRVLLERGRPPLVCLNTTQTTMSPVGVRDCATLLPGSMVLVCKHSQLRYGLILSVLPPLSVSGNLCRGDMIHQSSRCGLQVDGVHSKTFELAGVVNANANRPLDTLTAGEAGWFSETGVRIWLDSFMAQLAVDEACGLFAFYHDQLIRLAGHNMQQWSSGHIFEVLNDTNELAIIDGYATFPWEQLGVVQPGNNPFTENDAQATQRDTPHYARLEPLYDDQVPFHRLRTFRGYLGQGGKRILSGLPADVELLQQSVPAVLPGLFEEQLSLTGHYGLRSATGITLTKRGNIPVPRQKATPGDTASDATDTYKFSGYVGDGADHVVAGTVQPQTGSAENAAGLQAAAGILDLHAHLFNWEGSHAFHYHDKTWDLPEESAESPVTSNAEPIEFGKLGSQMYLAPPAGINVPIDHRYGAVNVVPNNSYISLLPEGGVVIGDGYGAEIRMVGGSIEISAPGDVWLKPGRNIQLWGGHDVIVKAHDSIDLSATTHDVRLKAERNMQMVAGNGSNGGILMESLAPTALDFEHDGEGAVTGGIVMKCKQSSVVAWASNIYLRTGGGDIENAGSIVLDANAGQATIVTNSNAVVSYLSTSYVMYFADQGQVQSTTIFSQTGSNIGSSLSVDGTFSAQGAIINRGGVYSVGGSIAAELEVGKLTGDNLSKVILSLSDVKQSFSASTTQGTTSFQAIFTDGWYAEHNVGNDDTIESAKFTFRTTEDYKSQAFVMFESRWQQLARIGEQGTNTWEEVAVGDTWPYPGQEALITDQKFFTQDLELFDVTTGNSHDRTAKQSQYETPKFKEPGATTVSAGYSII